jgi:hypothetical protein
VNDYRELRAHELAARLHVTLRHRPHALLLRWRGIAVIPVGTSKAYARITACGITNAHAERRVRRAVRRELLSGWF